MREQGSSNPEAHRQVSYWTSLPLTSLGLVGVAGASGEITSPAPPPDEVLLPSDDPEYAPNDMPEESPGIHETVNVTTIDGTIPSLTASHFYRPRQHNVAAIGSTIAPQVMAERPEGSACRILNAGSGSGRDDWSLASILSLNGVNYHIDGVDVNSLALARAQLPYDTTKADLQERAAEWNLPENITDFFDAVGDKQIQPSAALRERVQFHQADLREHIPTPGKYDLAIANNIFMYYERKTDKLRPTVDRMLGNIVAKLETGGLFTFSDRTTAGSYLLTDDLLEKHGLVPEENRYGIPDDQWQLLAMYRKIADAAQPEQ